VKKVSGILADHISSIFRQAMRADGRWFSTGNGRQESDCTIEITLSRAGEVKSETPESKDKKALDRILMQEQVGGCVGGKVWFCEYGYGLGWISSLVVRLYNDL
jgi:hypothetical protein